MTAIMSGWADAGMQYSKLFDYVEAGWFFGPKMLEGIFLSDKNQINLKTETYWDSEISYTDY